MSYFIDVLIVLLLAFFAWRGAAKGLILSLCGLAAVFVAFFAARFISDAFCVPVANVIRPVIENSITETMEDAIRHTEFSAIGGGVAESVEEIPLNGVLSTIRESAMFQGLARFLEDAKASNILQQGTRAAVQVVSEYISLLTARAVLFGFAYIAILLAWFLVSHALDLAFHLPILAEVNLAGGLALGLVKGVLLIIVLVWLGQLAGWVPSQPDSPILSLFTVQSLSELLANLPT